MARPSRSAAPQFRGCVDAVAHVDSDPWSIDSDPWSIIRARRNQWVIAFGSGRGMHLLCWPNGRPRIITDVPESKFLAMKYGGRRVEVEELVRALEGGKVIL